MLKFERVSWALFCVGMIFSFSVAACKSKPPIKTQKYAELTTERTFEYELPVVWKAIEHVFENHRIIERDPKNVESPQAWSRVQERSLKSDWIYSRSKTKYIEYKVNDLPRKQYLQMRYRYQLSGKRALGGTRVWISGQEEVERLNDDGTSAGYHSVELDSGRLNEIIEKIDLSLLSARP